MKFYKQMNSLGVLGEARGRWKPFERQWRCVSLQTCALLAFPTHGTVARRRITILKCGWTGAGNRPFHEHVKRDLGLAYTNYNL